MQRVIGVCAVGSALVLTTAGCGGGTTTTTTTKKASDATVKVADRFAATYIAKNLQTHTNVTWNFAFDLSQGKMYQGYFAAVPGQGGYNVSHFFDKASDDPWQLTKIGYCAPQIATWDHILYTYGFGWLSDAKFVEKKTLGNTQCDLYTLDKPKKYSWSACLDKDGIPLEYTLLAAPEEVGSTLAAFISMVNLTVQSRTLTPSPSEESRLQPSAECAAQLPQQACNDTSVGPIQLWRQCGTCFDAPEDENGDDATGVISMVCQSVSAGSFIPGATNLARYDLNVSKNYGPFQMFNYIPNKHHSVGSKGLKNLVGKSVEYNACAMIPAPMCGQCSDVPMAGSWLSTPKAGHCAEGKPVGTDDCTWAVNSYAVKNFSCVAPHVKDVCATYMAATKTMDPKAMAEAVHSVSTALNTVMGPDSSCPDTPVHPPDEINTFVI